ncbi:MAG: hypothetical protein WKF34_07170 [Pyrinomonadaceae bacterium]
MKVDKRLLVRLCICLLGILLLFESSPAQADQIQERRTFWFSRAEDATYGSLKDTVFLSPLEQAILYARLGAAWWEEKPEEARLWLQKAVRLVETSPNKENPAEKQQRLATARLLLTIVSRVDKSLSDNLVNIVASGIGAHGENSQTADALIQAALSLVDSNPQRAVELGTISIRFGSSNSFASLVWALQRRSPDFARRLFLSALANARNERSEKWLSLLGYTAFTKGSNSDSDLPKDLQIELLKLYIEPLQATSITEENQKRLCGHVSNYIVPFVDQFNELLPFQTEQINPIVARCQTMFSPLEKEQADKSSETRTLKTIDDYLKASDEEKNLNVRTQYQYKAAQMAVRQGDHDRAISILDRMSEESRRLMRSTWDGHRWEWAAALAFKLWKQGSIAEMAQVLDHVPSDIRGFALVAIVDKFPNNVQITLVTELLSDAKKNLDKSKSSYRERIEGFLVLMRLYAKYRQIDEAADAFKDVTRLVNQITSDETSENKKSGLSIFFEDRKIFLEGIPPILFERREYALRDAIASINALPNRLLARLDLLTLCLAEYRRQRV